MFGGPIRVEFVLGYIWIPVLHDSELENSLFGCHVERCCLISNNPYVPFGVLMLLMALGSFVDEKASSSSSSTKSN
jgi:hypothetical protein